MRDTLATSVCGIPFEEFAYLEEKHHEDCLREFRLRARQETDAESTDSGYGHKEMFVEHVAIHNALGSLLQGVVTDKKIRHKIY